MARRSNLRIAFSPVAAKQSAFGSALSNGALTHVFNARSANHVDRVERVEDLFDCSGQYLVGKQVMTRYARLVIDFEIEIVSLSALAAYHCGVAASPIGTGPYTHAFSPIGPNTYTFPFGTYIVGFADGDDPGVILRDAVVNSLSVTARGIQRATARAEIFGNGLLPAASGFTFSDCITYTPLRMTDGAVSLDSENLLSGTDANHTAHFFEWSSSNNLLVQDDAWPLAVLDIRRLRRADVRTWALRLQAEGRLNDTLHAKGRDRLTVPSSIRVGSVTSGLTLSIPSGLLECEVPQVGWVTEAEESALNLVHRPLRVPGNALTPYTMTAVNSQSGAYLA